MYLHVVSLPDSDRRPTATERSLRFGYEIIFHDALDFRGKAVEELSEIFDIDRFKNAFGQSPRAGQVGCTISHLDLYKKLSILSSEYFLIGEDDFIPLFPADVARAAIEDGINSGADIILMGYSKMDSRAFGIYNLVNPLLKLNSNRKFGYSLGPRYKNTSSGAVAYAVSKRFVVQMALSKELPWFVADEWGLYSSFGFQIFHVSPPLFLEDHSGMTSTLEHERLEKNRMKKVTSGTLFVDMLKFPIRVLKGGYFRILMQISPAWRNKVPKGKIS